MIEVFKTNVEDRKAANMLIDRIHQAFAEYKANFDLDDCDRILRVKNDKGDVCPDSLINLLKEYGYVAEVLPDDVPSYSLNLIPFSLRSKGQNCV